MNRRLLNRIIRPQVSLWRVLVANAGTALGLAGLLLAVQLYGDFEALFAGKGEAGPSSDYLVLSKAVTLGNTLTLKAPAFTDEEVAEIAAQPFVNSLGEVKGNTFRIVSQPGDMIRFRTDLFAESVPDEFLDNVPENWTWKEGDALVPTIMSQEFLNLYNFVYAPSQGLPPLTRQAMMLVPLSVTVGDGENSISVKMVIRGFSSRITSVVVPGEFLSWANGKYGSSPDPAPGRLIVEVADAADPELAAFLDAQGYETNRDRLRRSRSAAAARIAVIVTGGISLLVAALSVLIAAMNAQLLISRSAEALSLLLDIGYERGSLIGWLLARHAAILALVLGAAFVLFRVALEQVRTVFADNGFAPQEGTGATAFLALALFAGVVLSLQYAAVRSGLAGVAGVDHRGELR